MFQLQFLNGPQRSSSQTLKLLRTFFSGYIFQLNILCNHKMILRKLGKNHNYNIPSFHYRG